MGISLVPIFLTITNNVLANILVYMSVYLCKYIKTADFQKQNFFIGLFKSSAGFLLLSRARSCGPHCSFLTISLPSSEFPPSQKLLVQSHCFLLTSFPGHSFPEDFSSGLLFSFLLLLLSRFSVTLPLMWITHFTSWSRHHTDLFFRPSQPPTSMIIT